MLNRQDAPRATYHIGAFDRPMLATGVEALKTLALALGPVPAETRKSPDALGFRVGLRRLVAAVVDAFGLLPGNGASSVASASSKCRWEEGDIRGCVDTFFTSGNRDVKRFAGLQRVRLDVDAGVVRVVRGATGATMRERACQCAIEGVRLLDDAEVLRIADFALVGGTMLARGRGSHRNRSEG